MPDTLGQHTLSLRVELQWTMQGKTSGDFGPLDGVLLGIW